MDAALNRFRAVQNRVGPPTHAAGPGPAMPALPTDPGSVGVPPVDPPPTQVPTSPALSPAPASPPPPVPAAASDGSVVTGMGPAQRAALEARGGESARAFQAIADQGTQARNQSAVLGTMLADTSAFQPGTTGANAFRAYVQRQAPAIARAFNIDPNQVAAAESFDKLGAQLLNA